MTDYTELKRLAEALSRAIEQAEHKPGQWAETAQSMGGICLPGEPFQIGKPWAKELPWANFSYKRDSWLAVAAVNALPQLMALIGENERLSKKSKGWEEAAMHWMVERDQLKAEVEALRAAVGFAVKEFNTQSSADGSGHADIARAVLRIAGVAMSKEAGHD